MAKRKHKKKKGFQFPSSTSKAATRFQLESIETTKGRVRNANKLLTRFKKTK